MQSPNSREPKATSASTGPVASPAERIQSVLLLACAIVLLIAGTAVKLAPNVEPGSREFLSGTFLKVGMVVGLAWVAAPQLRKLGWERLRGTGLAVLLCVAVLTAIRPRFGAIAAGLTVAGFVALALLGWVRGVIFGGTGTGTISRNTGKIEKNPTRR